MKPILLIAFLALGPALADQFSPLDNDGVAALLDRPAGASALTAPLTRDRAEPCGK